MEVGKIYEFYGQFEFGDVIVGKFEGTDETTGFLMFSDIALQKNCRYCNRVEIISRITREVYEKFSKGGALPNELVLHNKSMYNIDKISQIIEMKDYFNEA